MAPPPLRKIFFAMLLICLAASLFLTAVYAPGTLNQPLKFLGNMGGNTIVGMVYAMVIWKMVDILNRRHPWEQRPGLRFMLELAGIILIVIVLATLTHFIWGAALGASPGESLKSLEFSYYVTSLFIPVLATLFMEARGFFRNWRKALLRTERLKFSDLQTRHAYLQNQIKPHFLFNSLNVLSSLVHKNPDLAERFISELSKLFRRLLEMDSREIVPLQEEIEAFNSYLFLVKMRFGEALQVEVADHQAFQQHFIPPFTLQLLLENAVKHNDMAQDQPMLVRVDFQDDYVVVANTFRPKARAEEKSTGIGLKNLRERYGLMTRKQVRVGNTENEFIVHIPLLDSAEPMEKMNGARRWSEGFLGFHENWEKVEKIAADGSLIVEEKWSSKTPFGEQSWTRQRRKKQREPRRSRWGRRGKENDGKT